MLLKEEYQISFGYFNEVDIEHQWLQGIGRKGIIPRIWNTKLNFGEYIFDSPIYWQKHSVEEERFWGKEIDLCTMDIVKDKQIFCPEYYQFRITN